jgi:hypothetical protein
VREWRRDVPPALEDVMGRAMAKTPEARPSAAAFRVGVLDAGGELP